MEGLTLWALIFACICMFALFAYYRYPRRIEDPATIVLATFFVGVVLKALYYYVIRPVDPDPLNGVPTQVVLVVGMTFIALCIGAYLVGLRLPIAVDLPSLEQFRPNLRVAVVISTVAVVAATAGILIFLFKEDAFRTADFFSKRFNLIEGGATSRFFVFDYWVYKLLSGVKYAFYLLLVAWIARDEKAGVLFYLVITLALALTVTISAIFANRSGTLILLLDLMVLIAVQFSFKRAVVLGLLGVVAATMMIVSTANRFWVPMDIPSDAIVVEESATQQTVGGELGVPDPQHARPDVNWYVNLVGVHGAHKIKASIAGRYFIDLYKTAWIVRAVPDKLPYLKGESFIGWPFVLVPDSWWPSKPIFAKISDILSADLYGNDRNNVPPGLIGEAFWNFGWLGFIAVGFAGAITAIAYNTYICHRDDPVVQVVYAMIVTRATLIMFNSTFGDAILESLADVGAVLVLLLVCRLAMSKQVQENA